MKEASSEVSFLSLFVWPLTILALGFCFVKNDQISSGLNLDVITIILLILSFLLNCINQIFPHLKKISKIDGV